MQNESNLKPARPLPAQTGTTDPVLLFLHRNERSKSSWKDQTACLRVLLHTAVPAFQSFPWRTAQLQSFLCLALRKGRGFTSATQVLHRVRNEGCSMCFKGRELHRTKQRTKNPTNQLPWKQTNKKTTNLKQTNKPTLTKSWLWTRNVWECSNPNPSRIQLQCRISPGKKWTAGPLYPLSPICTGAEIAAEG